MIAVTGASGQLGRLVVDALLAQRPAGEIVALARDPAKLADLAEKGVVVRPADYSKPETLGPALEGVERLLLISSSEVGQRAPQHQAVIDAAKAAGVGFIAYTSILGADRSPMILASEHAATEAALKASGIPHALLRDGWYAENYVQAVQSGAATGSIYGAAGEGRVAPAPRADYAAAAAAVLVGEGHAGKTYELAGDEALTLAELAAIVSEKAGKPVTYVNLDEDAYKAALVSHGVPEGFAGVLADSDTGLANGWLDNRSGDLARLIGRPTTPMAETVATILAG